MKKTLLRTLFKKELKNIRETYERALERKVSLVEKNAQYEIEAVKKSSEIPKRIFLLFKDAEIIGIEKNNLEEEIYVFKTQRNTLLNIYLCSQSYQAINVLPRIMTDINNHNNSIKIVDVQTVDIDIGNGSILIDYLIRTAKKMKISSITGWLSPTDRDHFNRSEHYYGKFGFDVKFNDSRTSGSIELKIQ